MTYDHLSYSHIRPDSPAGSIEVSAKGDGDRFIGGVDGAELEEICSGVESDSDAADEKGSRASEEDDDDDAAEVPPPPIVAEEAKINRPRNPSDPTPLELSCHYASGHLPYRPWCSICVKARGHEDPHYKQTREER